MAGMNRKTGKAFADEVDHIRQSVVDILTTPVGSRVKRRTYGSLIPPLIDQPINPANRLRLMAATVMALMNWEPRITVMRSTIDITMDGKTTTDLYAVRRSGQRSGDAINLSIPLR